MTDMSDRRVPAAQEAMKKTPEELVTWLSKERVTIASDNPSCSWSSRAGPLPLRTGLQRRRRKPPSTRKPMLATCCGQ